MANKKIYLIAIIVTLFFVGSCNHEDTEKVFLEVTDINLTDIGRLPAQFEFDIESINNNVKKCTMRTRAIKKNDNIKSIEVFIQGKHLNIDIISYPYDFECSDNNCFTVHDLSFNIVGLNNGTYNVCTRVNYSETNEFYITN